MTNAIGQLELNRLLSSWDHVSPELRQRVEAFASPEASGRRYALGRNEDSAALSKVIELDAFVDDFAERGTEWHGKPVIRGEDVPPYGIVVNCSTSISPVSAARRLAGLNIAGVLGFSDLCRLLPERVRMPDFIVQTRQDLELNPARWELLAEALGDAQSRLVLVDLLRYRTTGDWCAMNEYSIRFRDQYFEDFLGLTADEVFVDGGGYDGDTTEEFCARYPNFRKVLLFEPSTTTIERARHRLRHHQSIEFIEKGLADTIATLRFNANQGSASAICESGSSQIQVTTLDLHVQEKVSFIKMDLEGWELSALAGSKRHILEDHPILAIAVYHHPSHFWQVFDFVMGLRPDYDVYLRHYTEGWSETVMYFVPRACRTGAVLPQT